MGSAIIPASSSPVRIAVTVSEEFWPTRRTRTAGWRRRKSATRSVPRYVRAVPQVPNAARPPRSSRTSPTDAAAASAAATVASACGRSVRPASVSTTPRPTRWKSATPNSASRRRTCSDSDGWARCSASAAPENEPCSIVARK